MGHSSPAALLRRDNGALDIDHYVANARALQCAALHELLRHVVRGVVTTAKYLWNAVQGYRRRRALRVQLNALDARELRDAGIAPDDIDAISAGRLARRPEPELNDE